MKSPDAAALKRRANVRHALAFAFAMLAGYALACGQYLLCGLAALAAYWNGDDALLSAAQYAMQMISDAVESE